MSVMDEPAVDLTIKERIFSALSVPLTVTEIEEATGLARAQIQNNLCLYKKSGEIEARRDGTFVRTDPNWQPAGKRSTRPPPTPNPKPPAREPAPAAPAEPRVITPPELLTVSGALLNDDDLLLSALDALSKDLPGMSAARLVFVERLVERVVLRMADKP